MASRSASPPGDSPIDQEQPLLAGGGGGSSIRRSMTRRASLRGAARFLSRAGSRRMMREPSRLVRETAAEHLEERQSDWAYSWPVVVLDIMWNLAFVAVAVAVLTISRRETPSLPLRIWIVGYALQCVLHMVCVCIEYRKRHPRVAAEFGEASVGGSSRSGVVGLGDPVDSEENGYEAPEVGMDQENDSVAKHLESANTMFSFIWWIVGFYWVSAGGQTLFEEAPQLYWLCLVFLAFDVFFVVLCVILACFVGIAVCCCLPCIIAVLYAVADQQEGASDEDIQQLTKYKFRRTGDFITDSAEVAGRFGGIMTECGNERPSEHALSAEDAECCICISAYDDGAELRMLPCNHHFHCSCIDKWLFINATCPLCKYNIIKSGSSSGGEEV